MIDADCGHVIIVIDADRGNVVINANPPRRRRRSVAMS